MATRPIPIARTCSSTSVLFRKATDPPEESASPTLLRSTPATRWEPVILAAPRGRIVGQPQPSGATHVRLDRLAISFLHADESANQPHLARTYNIPSRGIRQSVVGHGEPPQVLAHQYAPRGPEIGSCVAISHVTPRDRDEWVECLWVVAAIASLESVARAASSPSLAGESPRSTGCGGTQRPPRRRYKCLGRHGYFINGDRSSTSRS